MTLSGAPGLETLVILDGAPNTYTGTTTVNSLVLELFKPGSNVTIPGDLNVSGTEASPSVILLTKKNQIADTGTVTLNANTTMTIRNRFNQNNFGDTFAALILNGATLEGEGQISAPLTVTGGTIRPGEGIGTLDFVGDVSLDATSAFEFQLGPDTGSDLVNITGIIDIGTDTLGFSDFNFSEDVGIGVGVYTLVTTTAGVTGSLDPADLTGMLAGEIATLSVRGQDIVLTIGEVAAGGFDSWAEMNGLTGEPGFENGFNDDPDLDGIANGLEFYLGGVPLVSGSGVLPTVVADGEDAIFSFDRLDEAVTDLTGIFQWSTDLENWNDIPVTLESSTAGGASVTVSDNTDSDPSTDSVSVSIPKSNAPDGKLFGRLQVTKP